MGLKTSKMEALTWTYVVSSTCVTQCYRMLFLVVWPFNGVEPPRTSGMVNSCKACGRLAHSVA